MTIAWDQLRNPFFQLDAFSVKDVSCAWRAGIYYLFFSAFDQDRSRIAWVKTRDFLSFSEPIRSMDGIDEGWVGLCSPDSVVADGKYVLTFNSWGDKPGKPNQLFSMTSSDLEEWGPMRPLAPELTTGKRAIDAALAWTGAFWVLVHRRGGGPFLAVAPSLSGSWEAVQGGEVALEYLPNQPISRMHENFQIVRFDERWRLLCTGFPPHHPYLFTMEASGDDPRDWLRWTGGYRLAVPQQPFNTVDRDNAAALYDMRQDDGHFYLFYGGKNKMRREEFRGEASSNPWPRGWNRLGMARSTDLQRWEVPRSKPESELG